MTFLVWCKIKSKIKAEKLAIDTIVIDMPVELHQLASSKQIIDASIFITGPIMDKNQKILGLTQTL